MIFKLWNTNLWHCNVLVCISSQANASRKYRVARIYQVYVHYINNFIFLKWEKMGP